MDPYIVTYMDEYAILLKNKSDYAKLNKLVHDLLNVDSTRPEVFVALSVLWQRKDERGALTYAEKVRCDFLVSICQLFSWILFGILSTSLSIIFVFALTSVHFYVLVTEYSN